MTPTELMALPDAELSHLSAWQVMGWTFMDGHYWIPDTSPREFYQAEVPWNPTTDYNDAFAVQKRIAELGLHSEFVEMLNGICMLGGGEPLSSGKWMFILANAPCRQRCVAAIAAVRGVK